MEKKKKNPDPPYVYSPSVSTDHRGLLTPSHFETRRPLPLPLPPVPMPPVPLPPQPQIREPWADLAEELSQLRKENEELKKRWARGESTRARSLDRHPPSTPPAESQALEIISQQMREIRRLELEAADVHEKEEKLARLTQEGQDLRRSLREAKEAEDTRKLAEAVAAKAHREEITKTSEKHRTEAATLTGQIRTLELELKENREKQEQEAGRLRRDLQATNQERGCLAEQLSRCHQELDSQTSLVQQLRTYIGELVPDNRQLEEQKRERTALRHTILTLEKERETLQTSVSLLQTRLSSLANILSLQEAELCRKGVHADGEKTRVLLSRWREKVFSLLVQMKSEEINRSNDNQKITEKISLLEGSLEERNQQQILLSHSLRDRTAELEMERVRSKSLQDELSVARAMSEQLQSKTEKTEQAALQLKAMIDRFVEAMSAQEGSLKAALSRLVTLGQRVSFAAKRVDTTQGLVAQRLALVKLAQEDRPKDTAGENDTCRPSYEDLEKEAQFLHGERDRLSLELKRSALLIEGKVTETKERAEAEFAECQLVVSNLRQSLREAEQREHVLSENLAGTETRLQVKCASEAELREQLQGLQEEYETVLQRKVKEVEEKMTQQLSQMEKNLLEARREHTKAVVTLRQSERQMQREKARSRETLQTVEEAARLREEQLSRQLRQTERDRNLMTATLRQEGLLNTYQKNRSAAVQASRGEKDHGGPAPKGSIPGSKECVSAMLTNLQSLGDMLLNEEEEDEEEGPFNP